MYYLEKQWDSIAIYQKTKGGFMKVSLQEIIQKLADGRYTLDIEKLRKIRSENQNDFYWGAFLITLWECMGEIIPEMTKK